jgi:serine protease Do
MSSLSSRARWAVAVVVAFGGGLLFASSMDWTRLSFAQSKPSAAEIQPITDASNAFVSIADHVTPAVVSIQVDTKTKVQQRQGITIPPGMLPPGFGDPFENFPVPQRPMVQEASGSGFIVSPDGYILTNNHVVTGPDHKTVADRITVRLLDHREFAAHVVGNDPTTDIAVIKIDGKDFPTIPLGNDNNTRVGEWVLAVGNPLGLDFTVTAGIVSAKGRSLPGLLGTQYGITDLLQTDAAINPGNSGGPLVNSRGEVIGVNSAIASQTGYYSGYGFAIPITLAKRVMDQLIKYGKARFGILGIGINEVDADAAAVAGMKEVRGAIVENFLPDNDDNPARRAGLQVGDIIVAADGQQIDRVSTLQRIVHSHVPGDKISIEVMRYGQQKSFTVRLGEAPSESPTTASRGEPASNAAPSNTKLGIQVGALPSNVPKGFPSHGVVVQDVEALGPAYGKLFSHDIITDVLYPTNKSISSINDLDKAVASLKEGSYISLRVFHPTSNGGGQSGVANIRIGG